MREIGKIKKPIVWTLSDMWPYCGSEHYVQEDLTIRYSDGYQKNNRPLNHHGIDLDQFTKYGVGFPISHENSFFLYLLSQ